MSLRNLRELDCTGKPAQRSSFPHPALARRPRPLEGRNLHRPQHRGQVGDEGTMSEVIQRKDKINRAIIEHDAVALAASLVPWLEATAYLRVLPSLGKMALPRADIPPLADADLQEDAIVYEADDAIMAFCIVAGLSRDRKSVVELHGRLTAQLGPDYPGSSAFGHCMQAIDPIVTLDDAVGQYLKAMLDQKALDPKDIWNAGLRVLQRARSSNFVEELIPVLAQWLRESWYRAIRQQRFNLTRPQTNVPVIEEALEDPLNDQAFVAVLLLASTDATGMEIEAEYRTQLAALARRAK